MENNLKIPFAIGQIVYSVGNGYKKRWITCPGCLGDKFIKMVQGNGQVFQINCAGCSLGYDPPTGILEEIYYEHTPTTFICNRVSVDGNRISYSESLPDSTCYSNMEAQYLFADKEDCQRKCDKLNKERTEHEKNRMLANLSSKKRDMAYSVHYWSRKVKDLERDLEIAKDRLNVCKEV